MARLVSGLVLACLTLCACEGGRVDAPEPTTLEDKDSMPSLPASLIEAPITYDFTPVVQALENAVPKKFGDLARREQLKSNKRVKLAFEAQREPFKLTLDGDTARMTAIINYAGRVWYNPPLAPEVSASCGTSGLRPRALIEVATPITLTPDWKLRSRTRVRRVQAYTDTERDQCEVTMLKIDVTGRVVDAARGLLEKNSRVVDAKVAGIDLRSKFEEWWALIQQPIHLTDTVWLVINPKDVHVGRARGSRKLLQTGISLTAEPRIMVGRKPVVAALPLPRQVAPAAAPDGFHVLLEGVLPYDVASKLLTEELKGEKVTLGRRSIKVQKVRMFGVGGGKIALEVEFAGATRGHVYFVGTPHYDYAGDRLYVPDLDYDVGSAHILVHGLSWLKHDDLRNYLRNKARWPVGGLIKQGHAHLMDGLNRELAPGVRLSGIARDVAVVGVHASRDAVRVRAHADGDLRLDVRPAARKIPAAGRRGQ